MISTACGFRNCKDAAGIFFLRDSGFFFSCGSSSEIKNSIIWNFHNIRDVARLGCGN